MEKINKRIEELNKLLTSREEELKLAEKAKTTDASIVWRRELVNSIRDIKDELNTLQEEKNIQEEKIRKEEAEKANNDAKIRVSKVAYFHNQKYEDNIPKGDKPKDDKPKDDKPKDDKPKDDKPKDDKPKDSDLERKKILLNEYKRALEDLRKKYKDDKNTLNQLEPIYLKQIENLEEEIAKLEGKPIKKKDDEKGNQGPKKDEGEQGNQGPKKDEGEQGNQGPKKDEGEQGNQGPKKDDEDKGKYDKGAIELFKREQETFYDNFIKNGISKAKEQGTAEVLKSIDTKYKNLAATQAKEKYETTSRMKFFRLKFAKNREKYGFFRALFKSFRNDKEVNDSIYEDMYSDAYNSNTEKMKTEKEEKINEISVKIEEFYNKSIDDFKRKDISERMKALEADEKDMPPETKKDLEKIKKRMQDLSEDIKKYNEEKKSKNNNKDKNNNSPKKPKEAPTQGDRE